MIANNDYYIIADKKTYTKEQFIREMEICYDYKVGTSKINSIWMRYSPLVESCYGDQGAYCQSKSNTKGGFECWMY